MALGLHKPVACFGELSFSGTWSRPHRKQSTLLAWELSILAIHPWSSFKDKKICKEILNSP